MNKTLRDELNDNADLAKALIGVVDLRSGQAVHAVAGERESYRGVRLRDGTECADPRELIHHYRSLGVRRFYFADLDSIIDGKPQTDLILKLLDDNGCGDDGCDESMIDIGWNGSDAQSEFAEALANDGAKIIAATETALTLSLLRTLVDRIGPTNVLLGVDYRDESFVGGDSPPSDWIKTALQIGVQGFLPLDVASVGTGNVAIATRLCREVRATAKSSRIYTGGGIKTARDVVDLQRAGCDGCLVATALL